MSINGQAAVITTDSRLSDARTPTAHTHPLSDLTQSSATTGQVPSWNGTAWVPTTPASGGGSATTDASLLTSGTLADARLSSNVSLDNINNNFTSGQSITAPANTSALTASYSVTGANTTPLLDLSGTWNTTGVARGILLNITDTASNATSRLLDLQRGGSSVFNVSKFGTLTCGQITTAGNQITCGPLFTSQLSLTANNDTNLFRDAANTLAQRNGTNAQTFRLYGTFTDASNARRLDITSTTAGVFTLTATGVGTGASGNLLKMTAPILLPSASVSLATNGDLAFEATSNTTLTIRYRGSDGTTRSAAIALA
jgi:hypothetical protein